MFGTWISDLQRVLSTRFPADRAYAAEDLKSSQMPTAVGHFLVHALKRRAARIEFSVESEWFNPDAPEVRSAFETYRKALTSTARYPQSAWESSLGRAIQYVTAYITNPASGLVSFVFGDADEPVPVGRVRERLGYFGTHQALKEIILGYLDRKKVAEIGPDDLRALVLKADRSLVKDFEPEAWATHLAPLYEIAAVLPREAAAEPSVPIEILKTFFEAKDCGEIVRRLEALESVKGRHALDVEAVRKVAGEQPEPVEEKEVAPQVRVEPSQRVPGTRVVRNDIHREGKPPVVPRWMQFAGGNGPSPNGGDRPPQARPIRVDDPAGVPEQSPAGSDAEGAGKIGQRAPVPDDLGVVTSGDGVQASEEDADNRVSGESVPRWTKFRESAPPPADNVTPTDAEERVLGRLNAVQRAWFINHLFGSDRAHWKVVMELLGRAEDWNEASEIIATEVFDRHGVDIYSRPAVDFTNAVEARFR